MKPPRPLPPLAAAASLLLALAAPPAHAVDGVIEINQAKALAGDVTPGDLGGFPIVISQSGSYRLTSDLRVPDAVNAIGIDSAFVVIDLNGFGIYGPCSIGGPGCSPGGTGVGIDAPLGLVTVKNGFISGTNNDGLRLGGGSQVIEVTVWGCGGDGIDSGNGGIVQSSRALSNLGVGLHLGSGTSFTGNESRGNSGGSRVGGIATGGNACDDGRCTRDGRRRFYVTTLGQAVQGSQAKSTCAAGFHMAFLSEILNPSALEYDGVRGDANPPGSAGMPTSADGWIRTGFIPTSVVNNPAGEPNCNDYAVASGNGTVVHFESRPGNGTNAWSPWVASAQACSSFQRVWCIED